MKSGTTYDVFVENPLSDSKEKVNFKELSKSGKLVNSYNALLMADSIARNKR